MLPNLIHALIAGVLGAPESGALAVATDLPAMLGAPEVVIGAVEAPAGDSPDSGSAPGFVAAAPAPAADPAPGFVASAPAAPAPAAPASPPPSAPPGSAPAPGFVATAPAPPATSLPPAPAVAADPEPQPEPEPEPDPAPNLAPDQPDRPRSKLEQGAWGRFEMN